MKKRSYVIILILTVLLLGGYVTYNLYLRNIGNIDTQLATITTAYNSIDTECFIVRDENHGDSGKNAAIIKNSGGGVYIPYVEDGARVAAGDIIALCFSSESDAKAYKEKLALSETLDYYNKLQNQSQLSTLDIDKLERTINDNIISMISSSEKKDFSLSEEFLDSLKYDISAKKIATGEKLDFSSQIEQLKKEIQSLSKKGGNYKEIRAAFPGCFISNVDGFESSVVYSDVSSLSTADVDSLLSSEPAKVSSSSIGKIIDEYNWYAVCNVPKTALEKLKIGSEVKATFEGTNVAMISMKIHSVSIVNDGYAAVVLVSNEMNSDIAKLRKEKVKIIIDSYNGIRVPREAIRNAENPESDELSQSGNLGVYILYGQVVRLRKINVLYFGTDFAIIERETDNSEALKLYDMIITKGRNLYDGKIIN